MESCIQGCQIEGGNIKIGFDGEQDSFLGLVIALELNLCMSSNSLGPYLVMYLYAIPDIAHTLEKIIIYFIIVIIAQKLKPIISVGF